MTAYDELQSDANTVMTDCLAAVPPLDESLCCCHNHVESRRTDVSLSRIINIMVRALHGFGLV